VNNPAIERQRPISIFGIQMMNFQPANTLAVLTIALAALLTACAPDSAGTQQPTAERGAALFEENCSPCHGQQGRGPSMTEIRALSPEGLRSAILNHPTAGQIPERLPAARVQDIIEYLEEE